MKGPVWGFALEFQYESKRRAIVFHPGDDLESATSLHRHDLFRDTPGDAYRNPLIGR